MQSLANPQTLNRYSYCLNNPLKYVDPSGHSVDGDQNGDGRVDCSDAILAQQNGGSGAADWVTHIILHQDTGGEYWFSDPKSGKMYQMHIGESGAGGSYTVSMNINGVNIWVDFATGTVEGLDKLGLDKVLEEKLKWQNAYSGASAGAVGLSLLQLYFEVETALEIDASHGYPGAGPATGKAITQFIGGEAGAGLCAYLGSLTGNPVIVVLAAGFGSMGGDYVVGMAFDAGYDLVVNHTSMGKYYGYVNEEKNIALDYIEQLRK